VLTARTGRYGEFRFDRKYDGDNLCGVSIGPVEAVGEAVAEEVGNGLWCLEDCPNEGSMLVYTLRGGPPADETGVPD